MSDEKEYWIEILRRLITYHSSRITSVQIDFPGWNR